MEVKLCQIKKIKQSDKKEIVFLLWNLRIDYNEVPRGNV